ncbi:MAG: tryptophan--tRNA ligase [Patescibacteria group bacterium]
MKDKIVTDYDQKLSELGIEHSFIEHPAIKEVGDVMNFLNLPLSESSATLLMKADDSFVAIIRRGDTELDLEKAKKIINVKKLQIASLDEFTKLTGLQPGAAHYLTGFKTFIDKKVFENEYVYGGSGSLLITTKYKSEDLIKIPNSQIVELSILKAKQRVLSGIRATGRLHLGNYLGAVVGMLELQNDPAYDTLYMVADLHAVTTPYDKKTLRQNAREVVMDYLASGLDPEKSTIFIQSDIPEHSELAYYLSTVVSIARLQHLPTYKEKVIQYPEGNTVALLYYPILMAADILIYKAGLVPVGIDQEPHLEIAREIARKMNSEYGTNFPEPKRFATKGEYVPSLSGEGKMSKSVEGSFINLTDDLSTIKKRLADAPTDSGKGDKVPKDGGVANLLKFVELFQGQKKRKEYEEQYTSNGIKYSELKDELASVIYEELKPIQEKRKYFETHTDEVDKILEDGAERARKMASETVAEVKEKMGFK